MAGISSKSAGTLQNKEKTFQGQRFDDELGLNWIQFKWRNHDPQIGRFIEIDPLSEDYAYNSTYAFSENRVTSSVEIEGLEAKDLYSELGPIRDQRSKYGIPKSDTKFEKFMDGTLLTFAGLIGAAVAEIIPALGTLIDIVTTVPKSEETTTTSGGEKKVPNPNGKKGGEAHQNTVKEVEKEMKSKGMNVKREVEIKTPGGNKEKRFVDVEGRDPKTGEVRQVQVGKVNKDGTPVSRETKALDDIEKATKKRPEFVPYNQPSNKVENNLFKLN
jgi:RHS repeat-associated protein